ncbi:MAG: hypothetical protein QW292_11765 [Candidatus Parvarchaeota archaeon]
MRMPFAVLIVIARLRMLMSDVSFAIKLLVTYRQPLNVFKNYASNSLPFFV